MFICPAFVKQFRANNLIIDHYLSPFLFVVYHRQVLKDYFIHVRHLFGRGSNNIKYNDFMVKTVFEYGIKYVRHTMFFLLQII